jgi:M3 family oligoendopeptidase
MRFEEIRANRPTEEAIRHDFGAVVRGIESAGSATEVNSAIDLWEGVRREFETYASLTHLHFAQDVRNAEYKADKQALDCLGPVVKEYEVAAKKALLTSPFRAELEESIGATAFALWECDVTTFTPAISGHLIREAALTDEFMELQAGAKIPFDGGEYNLSGIIPFTEDGDRGVREAANHALWGWFDANRAEHDRIFDDMVKLRHDMATTLGFESYVELGYQRMTRVDYDAADVDRFRAEVRDVLVPLCERIRNEQAQTLGIDAVRVWDEKIFDPGGNPVPLGDEAWMTERAREMFSNLHPELDAFFKLMADGGFLDLPTREGKTGGGFCTSFPSYGVPYIFANFNGTKGDVEVFTHEMGHAFQCWMSRHQRLSEYLWPTIEACEIHSMSLEFLTYPQMDLFFGEDAERFRRIHLMGSLLFIPYGVAVDHFQHLIYAEPDATPQRRFEMWQEMERTYLPWRRYDDLPHASEGGFWQRQKHIYFAPFYYIDYTLAQTCALQFWVRGGEDFDRAMTDYVDLCRRGGEAPFQELARSAKIRSPFDPGCLRAVVEKASASFA